MTNSLRLRFMIKMRLDFFSHVLLMLMGLALCESCVSLQVYAAYYARGPRFTVLIVYDRHAERLMWSLTNRPLTFFGNLPMAKGLKWMSPRLYRASPLRVYGSIR